MQEGLIYTNDQCIGCNKCVRICSSFGASVSKSGPERSSIMINDSRCIVCGACMDVCSHGARAYRDDTDALLRDLDAGEQISVLVAPAFVAKYPLSYRKMLGALRRRGVRRILPVAFGADICTWAYLQHLGDGEDGAMISTACPVVVSYVEHWVPHLIPRLLPVLSPLMCLAKYCREELGITDRFAFIGPCIGKRLEMDRHPDLVQYNSTFPKLMASLRNELDGAEADLDELDYGLGSYYPAPGGLQDNIRWLTGDEMPIRVVSGKQYLYERFEQGTRGVLSRQQPYVLLDALNCQEGCIEGTARSWVEDEDIGLAQLAQIRRATKSQADDSPWNAKLPHAERLRLFNERFAHLNVSSYAEVFEDKSASCSVALPTREEAEQIYQSLHKYDQESRRINCSACGYDTCAEMMTAIHNGFNSRYNCVYFEKEEAVRLAHLSYTDKLTGVMNRNALEMTGGDLYGEGHSLGLVVADVNGLKRENDSKGHAAGDRLIVATGKALANVFGLERVFRTGGDEFLVILQDYTREEVAEGMASVKAFLKTVDVSVSLGHAFTPSYDGAFDALQKMADSQMYEDKSAYYAEFGRR